MFVPIRFQISKTLVFWVSEPQEKNIRDAISISKVSVIFETKTQKVHFLQVFWEEKTKLLSKS
jgi:hypothetical protein